MPASQPAQQDGAVHPDLYRHLNRLRDRLNKTDLPGEVRFIVADDASESFDSGVGFGAYAGWGLADGSDGRPSVPDMGALKAIARVV